MASFMNEMEELWRGDRSPSPIARTLGFELVEYKDGTALFTMLVDNHHWSQLNTVQGGVMTAIAESAIGVAFATTLGEDETFTVAELHIHYLRAIRTGRIDARAKVVERRRRLGLVECELRDEHDLLLAKVSSTCIVIRNRPNALGDANKAE